MTAIGTLRPITPGTVAEFSGTLQTMNLQMTVRVIGNDQNCDRPAPSHSIYTRNRAGQDVQIGSAWLKTAKRGESAGNRFLSITIEWR